ncbi:hypothetical protein P171DRAFT_427410 [Karstenula rhodostoma CBS 690.94]|uniref:Carboxylic ester hydrolase n=1 Tax=Karstenula rhodostoma CBS 690.94 TaxID=1392251 RepID=A0A9P4PTS0_9PLEO|nr:hypothetical protein P171DRAFT_427410 [Karstenula rhodostoma CBS 690.94]
MNQYTSIQSISDSDLIQCEKVGGRIVSWHGMAGSLTFYNGTVNYYERVLEVAPGAKEYDHFYAASGVGNCRNGVEAAPTDPLAQVVRWVEEGELLLMVEHVCPGGNW